MRVFYTVIILVSTGCSTHDTRFNVTSRQHANSHYSVELVSRKAVSLSDPKAYLLDAGKKLCAPRIPHIVGAFEIDSTISASSSEAIGSLSIKGEIECR